MTGRGERGQTTVLLMGLVFVIVAGVLILGAFAQALGAKGSHQRAADLAAVSAASAMRDAYRRLFEPPELSPGVPNPRHLERSEYLALARDAAVRAGERNGVRVDPANVRFDDDAVAPMRVTVRVSGAAQLHVAQGERDRRDVEVDAKATAELTPPADTGAAFPAEAAGGGYSGPLEYRQGKPMRARVAQGLGRVAGAARGGGGALPPNSGVRSGAAEGRP